MAFGNGLRMARILGVPCYWTWNERTRVGGVEHMGDLFDVGKLGPDVQVLPFFKALTAIGPARLCSDGAKGVVSLEAIAGADVLLCCNGNIQCLGDEELSPALRRGFAAATSCIVPAPALAEKARQFAAAHDLRSAVGVHVRRGDLAGHRVERERIRLIGLDRYFAALDVVAADAPLFLCTEDHSVIAAFQARYPGRVFRYPTRSWVRDDATAIRDAVIEMFLLSATKFIVAGPSAFSRFAAARSMLPLVVLENGHSMEESIELAKAAVAALGAVSASPAVDGGSVPPGAAEPPPVEPPGSLSFLHGEGRAAQQAG